MAPIRAPIHLDSGGFVDKNDEKVESCQHGKKRNQKLWIGGAKTLDWRRKNFGLAYNIFGFLGWRETERESTSIYINK
jgi:hypothetical protein